MEYESVRRGWAYIGEDGILRPNPNAPHPRNCGLCGKRWHDDGCDMTDLREPHYGLPLPPAWLAVVVGIGMLLALLLLTLVLVV